MSNPHVSSGKIWANTLRRSTKQEECRIANMEKIGFDQRLRVRLAGWAECAKFTLSQSGLSRASPFLHRPRGIGLRGGLLPVAASAAPGMEGESDASAFVGGMDRDSRGERLSLQADAG